MLGPWAGTDGSRVGREFTILGSGIADSSSGSSGRFALGVHQRRTTLPSRLVSAPHSVPPLSEVFSKVAEWLEEELETLAEVPLGDLDGWAARTASLSPQFASWLHQERQQVERLVANEPARVRLCRRAADSIMRQLGHRNQFLRVSAERRAALEELFATYLRRLAELAASATSAQQLRERAEIVVEGHVTRVGRFVRTLWEGSSEAADAAYSEPVCAEYAPVLQLDVLGVRPETVLPPVLDIGCGLNAQLVEHLQAMGIEAHGIDRFVTPREHVVEADWLTYDYGTERWGTLVAHMSFSNHFVYHHQAGTEATEQLAKRYMAMLGSLVCGGSFYYAPALPFIEGHLPRREYRVERRRVLDSLGEGTGPVEATRVVRC